MHVLRLLKCLAHLVVATCYWLLLQGFHEPWIYGGLCGAYLLILATDGAR
jgi:hypothetical protein